MKDTVLEVIQKYRMLEKGEKVYVAVSGGQDSVTLLHYLNSIKKEFQLKLGIIHINHLLRGNDSAKDDFYVKNLAQQYNIPICSEKVDVGEYARLKRMTIEEAARHCRFNCFVKLAKEKGITKIAIGHTKDDNSETILMRIIRGTGLKGLRSIQPVLQYHGVKFIRPLIETTSEEVRKYSRVHRLKYRIDMSNRYIKYFRNKIRHELMPTLQTDYNPKVRESLTRLADTVSLDVDFLNTLTFEHYNQIVSKEKENQIILKKSGLLELHPALQYRVISMAVEKLYQGLVVSHNHWSKINEHLAGNKRYTLALSRSVEVELRRGDIIIQTKSSKKSYEYYIFNNEEVFVKECDIVLKLKEVEEEKKSMTQTKPGTFADLLDIDKLEFPLVIRNRKNGDRMLPMGSSREKKVKDILIDKKIPHYMRDEIPMLISKRKIVWCWGAGISEHYRITPETKRYLKLSATSKEA